MSDRETRDIEKQLQRENSVSPRKPRPEVDHPEPIDPAQRDVYHTISLINGRINRMSVGEMKRQCQRLHLDWQGQRQTVKRRLKEHYKMQSLIEAGIIKPNHNRNVDAFLVIDFEVIKHVISCSHEILQ